MENQYFYKQVWGRTNIIKGSIFGFFSFFASYPTLLLEVFVRRNFGHRRLNLASVLTVAVIAGAVPLIIMSLNSIWNIDGMILKYISWYMFLVAFVYKSLKHYRERITIPGTYDFKKFSKYSGDMDPRLLAIKFRGETPSRRIVATLIEPGLFLIIGIVLIILFQPLGYLLVISSIFYSLGYLADFYMGDQMLWDVIDKMIFSEELKNTCMDGRNPGKDKGFEMFEMPENPDYRRKMADYIMGDNERFEAH